VRRSRTPAHVHHAPVNLVAEWIDFTGTTWTVRSSSRTNRIDEVEIYRAKWLIPIISNSQSKWKANDVRPPGLNAEGRLQAIDGSPGD